MVTVARKKCKALVQTDIQDLEFRLEKPNFNDSQCTFNSYRYATRQRLYSVPPPLPLTAYPFRESYGCRGGVDGKQLRKRSMSTNTKRFLP